jgi:ribosomal protein L37AE/L43A
MNYCPCCSNLLLKHIRNSQSYWFCRTCWQEMPVIRLSVSTSLADVILDQVSRNAQLMVS